MKVGAKTSLVKIHVVFDNQKYPPETFKNYVENVEKMGPFSKEWSYSMTF